MLSNATVFVVLFVVIFVSLTLLVLGIKGVPFLVGLPVNRRSKQRANVLFDPQARVM
jgi:hypothetical protein